MYRFGKEEIEAASRVMESNKLFKTMGQETYNCERELCQKLGADYSILMTSGLGALITALTVLGVGPGDEVIVPAYTYIASAIAVTAVSAIPVIAEVNESLTLDPEDVKNKLSKYTKAIMPVHMQGIPSDLESLGKIARDNNIFIVEDACQAIGGEFKGKKLGSIGNANAISFNQFKAISAGEGGAMITNDKTVYENALIFHDSSAIAYFGGQLDNISTEQFCGNEYRTNEISSAILREQIKKLDGIIGDLRKNKNIIMSELKNDFDFIPSNDAKGECGIVASFKFETEEEARRFAKSQGVSGTLPIDTGKHVYSHWTPLLEKRGAFNPKMDPFKMEANKGLNFNIYENSCPKTLEILAKTVYFGINPDWTEGELSKVIKDLKAAKYK